jgi:L-fuculose-phosphate aldolase
MLLLGGPVRVAPYRTFGTPELAEVVAEALEGRTATILANHGTVCHGVDIAGAMRATELLEWAANLYLDASRVGAPRALDAGEQQAVIDAAVARSYGSTKAAEEAGG